MTTDRLSLLQFEQLSLKPAAASQFALSLKDLEQLTLPERYAYRAAHYLGDMAEAENSQQLAVAKEQGIGFTQGLLTAAAIEDALAKRLIEVFNNASERASKLLPQ
ncbi:MULTISPECIES: hypothetical protein [unclassified Pseudomonas]|uniref:hypothetical protein n=1 Tax=unclassified Pseudomonas TaxID=196821 RepID=UPI0019426C2B|nr:MULTISPECIES: hypothetical protein [unclassified Pseudomonas]MDC0690009.1 hypothetical protein [Mitsuaria sp. RG]MCE0916957.1 hypothetical protein [Pseudomonas sp. NMI760_13]MCF1489598.1 hypothetical protein [Pseudomonas sp. AA27]MCP8634837.1 hypothetical protein [Pseudomonas sp. DVZ6]MDD7784082.1 hypothetical protein [Pseudomonas sp. DVZ24]